jgi:hypothetical protein
VANKHRTSHSFRPAVRAMLVALLIVLSFLVLSESTCQMHNLMSATSERALVLLPSFVLTAWQVLQPDAANHQRISVCALKMLVIWPRATIRDERGIIARRIR